MRERVVENVKVGDTIKYRVNDTEGIHYDNMVIEKVFKHCVIGLRKDGIRRGISYGELVQRGLEPSYGDMFTEVTVPRTDYDLEGYNE